MISTEESTAEQLRWRARDDARGCNNPLGVQLQIFSGGGLEKERSSAEERRRRSAGAAGCERGELWGGVESLEQA